MPNQIVVHATVAAPCDLRFTSTGTAVCTVQLTCTHQRTVPSGTETKVVDEVTVFNTLVFGGMGEHAADSFVVGDMLIVTGRIRQNTDGAMELVADDIAASTRAATLLHVRTPPATPEPQRRVPSGAPRTAPQRTPR